MSLLVWSTSTFRESLKELCRRPKHNYGSCPLDICGELADKSVEELLTTNNAIINDDGKKAVIKIRVACQCRKTGKSGGFRVIAIADRQAQEVILLEVFPKTGVFNKANISPGELKHLLTQYIAERGEMVAHDLTQGLAPVVPDPPAC